MKEEKHGENSRRADVPHDLSEGTWGKSWRGQFIES